MIQDHHFSVESYHDGHDQIFKVGTIVFIIVQSDWFSLEELLEELLHCKLYVCNVRSQIDFLVIILKLPEMSSFSKLYCISLFIYSAFQFVF